MYITQIPHMQIRQKILFIYVNFVLYVESIISSFQYVLIKSLSLVDSGQRLWPLGPQSGYSLLIIQKNLCAVSDLKP